MAIFLSFSSFHRPNGRLATYECVAALSNFRFEHLSTRIVIALYRAFDGGEGQGWRRGGAVGVVRGRVAAYDSGSPIASLLGQVNRMPGRLI